MTPRCLDVHVSQAQYEMQGGMQVQWFDAIVLEQRKMGDALHGRRGVFCQYEFFFFDGMTVLFEKHDTYILG